MINQAYLKNSFKNIFQTDSDIEVKSPGRINIIGEHTDYNNGFVLPAAIDKYIYVALSKRDDNTLNLYSEDYKQSFTIDINGDYQNTPEWVKYILGVTQIIQSKTKQLTGFNLYLVGDVPLGAGLSSSAALSCATGFAINELYQTNLSRVEIAKIGQQTEHEYIGLKCGIMDQFASVLGKNNNAVKLDCKDLSYEYIPIDWSAYEILLMNSNVKHSLASSAYNDRRASCELAVSLVKEHHPEVQSLRDVNLEQLDLYVKNENKDAYTKSKFIIEENNRVLHACEALINNNIESLGNLLFSAHWALSKEYEVSCPELDELILAAQSTDFIVGARMMGGGFGGCTINIVKKGFVEKAIEALSEKFKDKFHTSPSPIRVALGDGSSMV